MPSQSAILLTGIAGLVAGAMSMAAGEYVSVSSQADTEHADIARENRGTAGRARGRATGTRRDLSPARARPRSVAAGRRPVDGARCAGRAPARRTRDQRDRRRGRSRRRWRRPPASRRARSCRCSTALLFTGGRLVAAVIDRHFDPAGGDGCDRRAGRRREHRTRRGPRDDSGARWRWARHLCDRAAVRNAAVIAKPAAIPSLRSHRARFRVRRRPPRGVRGWRP